MIAQAWLFKAYSQITCSAFLAWTRH